MKWSVLLASVLLVGACGGSERREPTPSSPKERVVDDSGLELCDGSRSELVRVGGDEAIDAWRELRRESGRWPVLIGSPDDASVLADMVQINCKDGHTYERTLTRAAQVDVERALARVARAYGVRAGDLRGSTPLPSSPPSDQFIVPFDLVTEQPLPEVWIALLPVDASWKAAAILPWGNYNDNPGPAVHAAVLRDWNRRYGAELVSMTGDVLELSVPRPPATDQAALALAREQFSYSPDIVQQGTGDVETLAATLKNGHAWYFWWD